jgi:hypothetical protein
MIFLFRSGDLWNYLQMNRKPLIERFWSKVRKTDTCWIWEGQNDGTASGYGRINADTEKGKPKRRIAVHRISWELHHGKIPAGMLVCHKCDVPHCVRPDHLFLGTPDDNSKDMVKKRRQAWGDKSGQTKHKESLVRKIRAAYYHRMSSAVQDLAANFGVPYDYVSGLVSNRYRKVSLR